MQAAQNGLVDEIGGLDRAIALIKEKTKIPADQKVTLVAYPQKRSLMDVLLSRDKEPATSAELDAAITKVMGRPALARPRARWSAADAPVFRRVK